MVSMLMRLMIGWVQMLQTPGSVAACVQLGDVPLARHPGPPLISGLRLTMVSIMLTGAGSVEVSARPILATTEATSGDLLDRRVLLLA